MEDKKNVPNHQPDGNCLFSFKRWDYDDFSFQSIEQPPIFMQNAGERMRFSISSNLQNMWEHKHVLYGTTMREWITIIIQLWLL